MLVSLEEKESEETKVEEVQMDSKDCQVTLEKKEILVNRGKNLSISIFIFFNFNIHWFLFRMPGPPGITVSYL